MTDNGCGCDINTGSKNDSTSEKNEKKSTSKTNEDTEEKWGFDLYPERRSNRYKPSVSKVLFTGEGNEALSRRKCENRVWDVINRSPLVRLMIGALKSSGCPLDISRHISCEMCDISLLGGYDQELNQIVICQNVSTTEGRVQGALTHELIHMFDFCRNKVNFEDIYHLACSEIRAANLTSCSFLTALSLQPEALFNIKKSHQECVKTKAVWSIKYARNVSEDEARAAVDKVFTKCYNDLEPVGRRVKRNSPDMYRAYRDRYIYGYE